MSSKNDDHKGGYSREGLFGEISHYDEHGHKIGESRPSFWGGYDDYDENGHKTGYSSESLFGAGYEHYDNKGNKIGYSSEDFFGGYTHHDAAGHVTGRSDRSVMDIKNKEDIWASGSLYGTGGSQPDTKKSEPIKFRVTESYKPSRGCSIFMYCLAAFGFIGTISIIAYACSLK